ncbi:MAG: hypothetical protein R2697_01985 [Ilumatobacteraceae bacterium]
MGRDMVVVTGVACAVTAGCSGDAATSEAVVETSVATRIPLTDDDDVVDLLDLVDLVDEPADHDDHVDDDPPADDHHEHDDVHDEHDDDDEHDDLDHGATRDHDLAGGTADDERAVRSGQPTAVRYPGPAPARRLSLQSIGTSALGREITLLHRPVENERVRVVVIGAVHGNEPVDPPIVRALVDVPLPPTSRSGSSPK